MGCTCVTPAHRVAAHPLPTSARSGVAIKRSSTAAVMPKYAIFEAWVCIDKVRLEEYDVQETVNSKGTRIVTCWIASEAERVRLHR
jgi:hypothetical protein